MLNLFKSGPELLQVARIDMHRLFSFPDQHRAHKFVCSQQSIQVEEAVDWIGNCTVTCRAQYSLAYRVDWIRES